MTTHRKRESVDVMARVIVGVIILALVAGVVGVRLAITGGDVGCVFAQDPALCVALKGVER
ncbi:hypothetical protein PTQ19_10340 [Microbacterium esteraromaticum]|uniref:hypothetical protein n=1 Tax=Microbacterium esteraromaticum TaxID=57043 RepID=UPI002367AD28|nr:hypothetical protein [Microbacterium esteraromaticum]WDH77920.1 hypothetical protein PTQ19_10340 [Microbacterium esteraromaticum]